MVCNSCLAYTPFGCGPCKPRYKRLVDGIYPPNPYEGGLVKNNMEKLLFFALSSPEKIDKIGKYLAKRLEADVYRRKNGWIRVSMQALDQLLVSCQAPDQTRNLNLFVESFLTMIRKLLECDEPELEMMAAHSFIKFANIEEDTPSYKRSYDFFISRFSVMCYDMSKDLERRKNMRMAGMHGLQGVVRKTVSDDLQVNIWEEQHMSKIIPALIYNMQERYEIEKRLKANGSDKVNVREAETAAEVAQFAQDCLRDICSRCGYTNVMAVIKPALEHHDMHGLWVPGDFAKMCISTMCYALPRQYAYKAVQILVAHLDQHANDDASIKISIIYVLEETVEIASTVGPSVFEVFDALLRHLKRSSSRSQASPVERRFQLALVNAIGEFAASLPDYQKIEVMQLILDKARDPTSTGPAIGGKNQSGVRKGFQSDAAVKYASGASLSENYDMQCMLLESLLKVADKYIPQQMSTSFPTSLLDLLLPLSVSDSKQVRLLVQDIFQSLVDRHFNKKNVGKLRLFDKPVDQRSTQAVIEAAEVEPENIITTPAALLVPEKQITSDDARFSRTHLVSILSRMCQYLNISNNDESCYQALFVTLTLIVLELGGPSSDAVVEVLRYCYSVERLFSQPSPGSIKPTAPVMLQNPLLSGNEDTPKIIATSSSHHEQMTLMPSNAGTEQQPSASPAETLATLPLPPPLPPTDPVLVTSGQQCAAVCLISCVYTLLVQVSAPKLDVVREHTVNVVSERNRTHRYLLPENVFPHKQQMQMENAEFERNCNEQKLPLLLTEETLNLLAANGIDVEKVRKPLPVHKTRDGRESPIGGGGLGIGSGADRSGAGGLDASSVSISLELDSDASSQSGAAGGGTEAGTNITNMHSKRAGPHPDSIRFETFKKILDEPIENIRAEKQRRQREIWRTFQETPVEELIHMVEVRRGRYAHTLDELLKTPSQSSQRSSSPSTRSRSSTSSDSNNSEGEAVAADTPPPGSARRHRSMFRGGPGGGPQPFKHFEPPDVLTY